MLASVVLGFGCSPTPQAPASLPNVLLVSLDTLRADHLGSYGYFRETAPTLTKMAARGAQFDESYSQASSTVPTHASLFSGKLPAEHETWGYKYRLSSSAMTIAEYLRAQGYRTFGVASSGRFAERSGFHQGFESFEVLDEIERLERSSRVVETTLEHMNARGEGEPWFGFVHLMDPHGPYSSPEPFLTRWHPGHDAFSADQSGEYIRKARKSKISVPPDILEYLIGLYDGAISHMDTHLGRMFETMQPANGRSTLIVITSDHGEMFMENGAFGHAGPVYEAVVRVPLIYVWPERIAPGIKIQGVAQSVDLFPTLVELLDLPRVAGFPGRSHAAVLFGADEPQGPPGGIRDVVLLQRNPKIWGVIATFDTGRFKLEQHRSDDRPLIYRLDQDRWGENDLFPAFEEERRVLERLHATRLETEPTQAGAEWIRETPPPPTQREVEELRALGYIAEAEEAEAELRAIADAEGTPVH